MNTLYISQELYNHYESIEEVSNYFGVLAIYALIVTSEYKNDTHLKEKCINILSRFPEHIVHDKYKFPSYTIGGIARAYAFYKGLMTDDVTRSLVNEYAEEMMGAPRSESGILCQPDCPQREIIWIDVAMAATPYLLFAGLALENDDYIEEACKQTFLMYEDFMDNDNGLLHQGRNFDSSGKLSEDHWSRGNGWGYLALSELVKHLPANNKNYSKAVELFINHSESFLKYQTKRGLWRQEIPLKYSYEESSGTGLILYGFGVGLSLGLLETEKYEQAFNKGIQGLVKYCINSDYSTNNSCPGCRFPTYEDEVATILAYVTTKLPYKDEHHSFAPFMLSLCTAYKLGVTDIDVGE